MTSRAGRRPLYRMHRVPHAAFVALIVMLAPPARAAPATAPVAGATELRLSVLGRPTATKRPAARKLNELFLFDGRLYLGHGDYGVNTGPTDVIAYDPAADAFRTEYTTQDEAIVLYRQLGDRLVLPGPDATEGWTLGNVYVRPPGAGATWEKRRTVPKGVHVLDVAEHRGQWYAAAGVAAALDAGGDEGPNGFGCGAVFSSGDEGKTWRLQYTTASAAGTVTRVGSLVSFREHLLAFPYAFAVLPKDRLPPALAATLTDALGGEGDAARYVVSLPIDAGFGPEAVSFDGRQWRPADVAPERNVCAARAFVFQNTLLVSTTSGRMLPSSRHYSVRRHGPAPGTTVQLWANRGPRTNNVPIVYDALVDVAQRGDRLALLVVRGGRSYVVTTPDLADWAWHALPGMGADAEPLSVELAGDDAFYVGASDGTLFKAVPPPPAPAR